MNRVGRDHIELLSGREDEMPCVVVDDACARIVQHGVVLRTEELVRGWRNERLELADDNLLHVWIRHERAGGDAGAEAYCQYRAWIGMDQRRDVTHHPLEPHVSRRRRRFR